MEGVASSSRIQVALNPEVVGSRSILYPEGGYEVLEIYIPIESPLILINFSLKSVILNTKLFDQHIFFTIPEKVPEELHRPQEYLRLHSHLDRFEDSR